MALPAPPRPNDQFGMYVYMPHSLLRLHACVDDHVDTDNAETESESESDVAVIELRQIAGYIPSCKCLITLYL